MPYTEKKFKTKEAKNNFESMKIIRMRENFFYVVIHSLQLML